MESRGIPGSLRWLGFDFHQGHGFNLCGQGTKIPQTAWHSKTKNWDSESFWVGDCIHMCQEGGILQNTWGQKKLLYSGHFQTLPSIFLHLDVHLYPL